MNVHVGARALALAVIVSVCAWTLAPGLARAQGPSAQPPSAQTPAPVANTQSQPASPVAGKRKKPARALLFSILGTASGFILTSIASEEEILPLAILGGAATFVGPSLGHVYTRDWTRAWVPIAVRAAGFLIFWRAIVSTEGGDVFDPPPGQVIGGLFLFVGATAYSLVDAPRSARRANRRMNLQLGLAPTPVIDAAGQRTMGLSLTGRF